MKRILFLTLAVFVAYVNYSYAGITAKATPSEYIVTINKVELYNNTTDSWETVGEGDVTFDIAAFDAGQVAGVYANNTAIPEGIYTQERTTVSRTFYITASGTIKSTTYYTTTGKEILNDPSGLVAIVASSNPSSKARGRAVITEEGLAQNDFKLIGDYFYHEGSVPSPITVQKGLTKKLRIKFNVTNAVEFNVLGDGDGTTVCYPVAPVVTFEVVD